MAQIEIELTSTLTDGRFACPGESVTFTCKTVGSYAIAWTSDQYIGLGGTQLAFAADFNEVGALHRSASIPSTFAALVLYNRTADVLMSTLHIITLLNAPSSSVTCIHVASDQRATINFSVIGKDAYVYIYITMTMH